MVYWEPGGCDMMSRSAGRKCETMLINIDDLVPQNHFLRKLDAAISFDFVYEIMSPLYSDRGRPSVDPVLLIKMLLIGYLYNIDSERKLEEDVKYNIAYRWYLGLDFDGKVPDHSTFSQNRRRRFRGHEVFREIFERIVWECEKAGLVRGENVVMDSTHIKANADNRNQEWAEVIRTPEAFWDDLGVAELPPESTVKSKNPCDPDAGYMSRKGKPAGFHYLDHQCSDADTGVILDVFVTGGDVQDHECCVERFAYLKDGMGLPVKRAGLDTGYDTIAVHFGLTRIGVTAYIPPIRRDVQKKEEGRLTLEDFQWKPEEDCYECPNHKKLTYRATWICAGIPTRNYGASMEDCKACPYREKCFTEKSKSKRIVRKPCQEFKEAGWERKGTGTYKRMLTRRSVVCEGNFGLQKRCHNLRFTRKRGIENVLEQCLLSASALNLKRLVKGLSLLESPGEMRALNVLRLGILTFFRRKFPPVDLFWSATA